MEPRLNKRWKMSGRRMQQRQSGSWAPHTAHRRGWTTLPHRRFDTIQNRNSWTDCRESSQFIMSARRTPTPSLVLEKWVSIHRVKWRHISVVAMPLPCRSTRRTVCS